MKYCMHFNLFSFQPYEYKKRSFNGLCASGCRALDGPQSYFYVYILSLLKSVLCLFLETVFTAARTSVSSLNSVNYGRQSHKASVIHKQPALFAVPQW